MSMSTRFSVELMEVVKQNCLTKENERERERVHAVKKRSGCRSRIYTPTHKDTITPKHQSQGCPTVALVDALEVSKCTTV